ncbi:MAG TPA: carbohydrate-binding protein, partial [Cytophagaceae bacterium]|nr:carbohydrate-binding protein [Cytophagaceae bacterium]
VNTTSGVISGTPTAAGTFNATVTATNSGGTGSKAVTITVTQPAPVINSAATANATVGTAFNYTITASNTPTSFGATGLPAGLSVNTTSGVISGTPTAAGTFNATVTATNSSGTGSKAVTITVTQPAPVISSAATATGTTGTTFSYQIAASNSPTSFGASGLPAGVSVNTTTGLISGTPTAAGTYNATVTATNSGGSGNKAVTITITAPATNTPYGGVAWPIPGKIEAENYDLGGQNIAYNDSETANQGGVYRTDGVDIQATTDVSGGYNVGWTADGEWLKYTVNVATTGAYNIDFRSAGTGSGVVRLELDGTDITGSVTLPSTGGWQTWATITRSNVSLTAGQHILRLFIVTGGFNINSISFNGPFAAQNPYNGVIALPGKIEAENYDLGGQNVAYNDTETANQGGVYRTDGVDIEACSDAGTGYDVGWTAAGEWLEYTVNVATTGAYDIGFRSAGTGNGSVRVEVDGTDMTGTIALPNTGGWQTWTTTTKSNVSLTAGQHVFRVFIIAGGFNLNYVTVSTPAAGPGFLHASGTSIVNNNGNFQIRAANIGNFMVQEGYMLNFGGGYQHDFQQKIANVIGTAARDQFYTNYRDAFLTKSDIDSLAKWGFNAIRLPMHYNLFTVLGQPNTFIESGFAKVDQIISWCKANNMYVILDLHATPGGQSSGDISDYVAGQPSLWESDANRAQTVALWQKFAQRYVNEQYVGGYDLINETNWTLPGNTLLAQLMKDITTAIRQVDNNHILFIEGNSYANDYTGLTPKWDNNMAYSFHKYWNDVNDGSISWVLSLRDAQNVPIWLGEFGENSNSWISETVTLMNNHNIGWSVWTYKKMTSTSAIGSFNQPDNWSTMSSYMNGGSAPSASSMQTMLNQLVENVKSANVVYNYGYIFGLFGGANNQTKPYEYTAIPGKVSAAKYDEGKNGLAYSDVVYQTAQYGAAGGDFVAWNTGYAFRNDGVDLQYSASENTNTVGWTQTGEWMQYTVQVLTSGSYTVKVRAAGNGGKLTLSSDGATLLSNATINGTGGWDTWQTMTIGTVNLTAGTHTLRVTIAAEGYNINYLEFTNSSGARLGTADVMDGQAYVTTSLNSAPNPFSAVTKVDVTIAEAGEVSLEVFDNTGISVQVLYKGYLDVGTYSYEFDSKNLKSDLYLVKLNSNQQVLTRKIVKSE